MDYQLDADFCIIYIEEAHAIDEWPIGERIPVKQHQNISQRREIAQKMVSDKMIQLPVLLDSMNQDFEREFAAWPARYFVIYQGRVELIAVPKNCLYQPAEIRQCLEQIFKI
jgi:hypothetical protein